MIGNGPWSALSLSGAVFADRGGRGIRTPESGLVTALAVFKTGMLVRMTCDIAHLGAESVAHLSRTTVNLGRDRGEGDGSGLLLRLLLAAARPLAPDAPAHQDRGVERLGVVGALLGHHVLGDAEAVGRGQLLETGLPVEGRAELRRPGDEPVDQTVHQVGTDLDAVLQVGRADQRLEGVGEDRGLVPPAAGLLAT